MAEKIKFPDGREVDIHEFIAFMYGLSKSDVELLHMLMTEGKMTTDDIASKLNVTKASISKSLNSLIDKGLVEREKVQSEDKRKGRPNFMYWVDREKLYSRLDTDLEKLLTTLKGSIQKTMTVAI
ncbi:helix-turn-helix domain-containing protein [Sulfuracidifex metallicus]|uniref:MarR family transcriptional regulator n=1 Tax=Sulfuracidifex metallicus DSM 6482 = JCM 9184 TaxID=523847 RepID=A0A6A9QKX2_SULME|nr:helix-turn-helix domain-containing protein [Sulfuracidifex metallicus]MUN29917.1 MarR family transcriptional regulator [Sulfuracidifex metallicus DSM 6482 = JCM 9184]WOE51698.1 helix-turn-helix domain-containing protein [Sulfuracidifex metallicus DSM 6482 = JCM 9184]